MASKRGLLYAFLYYIISELLFFLDNECLHFLISPAQIGMGLLLFADRAIR
jgi:hypothetical protein